MTFVEVGKLYRRGDGCTGPGLFVVRGRGRGRRATEDDIAPGRPHGTRTPLSGAPLARLEGRRGLARALLAPTAAG